MIDDPTDPKISAATVPLIIRDSDAAPFLYFDIAPAYGIFHGAIQIEVASRVLTVAPGGGAKVEFVTTAHIRCSVQAATNLRNALDDALKMLEQPEEGPAVGMGRLN